MEQKKIVTIIAVAVIVVTAIFVAIAATGGQGAIAPFGKKTTFDPITVTIDGNGGLCWGNPTYNDSINDVDYKEYYYDVTPFTKYHYQMSGYIWDDTHYDMVVIIVKKGMTDENSLNDGYTKYSNGDTEYYYRMVTNLSTVVLELSVSPGSSVSFSVDYEKIII